MPRSTRRTAGVVALATASLAALVVAAPAHATVVPGRPGPAAVVPAVAAVAPSRGQVSTLPSRVKGVADAAQLIVVTRPRSTSYATLTAYQRTGTTWRVAYGPWTARVGLNGFARPGQRRQGTMTTPSGTFTLGAAFGNGPSPGTRMPYRRVDADDRWVYDPRRPASYNTYQPWVRWSSGYQERLAQLGAQYRYVVNIGYNKPVLPMSTTVRPAAARGVDTRAGGGIFLHVIGGTLGGATAGCVSVTRDRMRALLRWLDPAKRPVMAMGRVSDILRPLSGSRLSTAATQPAPAALARTAVVTQTIGTSRGGRPIVATVLGPADAPRRLVVVGVIHGNERAGKRVTDALRRLTLPAGLRVWLGPTRTNAAGVDLNRNFPRAWRYADRGGSRYSGPRAASEPETRAMMAMLDRVDPGLVAIFHQPLYGVDSYGAKSMRTVRALASRMALPVRSFDCQGGCHGTLTQWFNATRPGQAITVEFPGGTPSSTQVSRVARGVLAVGASARVRATG